MKKNKMTTHLKFNIQFDEKKLVKDLGTVLEKEWIPHFNKSGYEGNWTSISLYAKGGDTTNIFAFQNDDVPIMETPIMKDCPYFMEVLRYFKCRFLSVRLLKLDVGAEIKPHRDHALGYEDNCFRLHIPIVTNPDVSFILDDERLEMLPGECWYTNVNFVHSVSNKGDIDRVHLVIDGERNSWSDKLFFSMAPEESFIPPQKSFSPETINRMLEELKHKNNPAAEELIAQLEAQLNKSKN